MNKKVYIRLLTSTLLLGILFFIIPIIEEVNAAVAGPNNGSIFNTGVTPLGGAVGWNNVANVQTSNGVYAVTSSSLVNTSTNTQYSLEILTTGFGFTIPANAVINSVTIGIQSVKSNDTTGEIYAYVPRMIVGGVQSNLGGGSIYPVTTTPGYISYTLSNDADSGMSNFPVTPAQVNASNFGVAWFFQSQSANTATVSVDHVRISIDYTVPAAPSNVYQDAVTSMRPTSALLVGHLQSNSLPTTGYFKWGTTNTGNCSTLANTTSSTTLPASGSQNNAFSSELTGLTSGQTYYYCAVGNNTSGTLASSNIYNFTTPSTTNVSGPNNPTSSTTSGPWNGWLNTANIYSSDGALATNTVNGNYPNYLQAWGFGFSIPASATITGVVADVKGSYSTGVLPSGYIQIWKNAGAMANNVLNMSPLALNSTSQYLTAGSSTNITPGALTAAEVNNSTFGLVIWNGGPISGTFSVDHARMTIYYVLTPTLTLPTQASITSSNAILGATVTSNAGVALSARGICWAVTTTNNNPQIGGAGVTCVAEGNTAVSAYTQNVTGLPLNTQITYQGYATNANGTGYSGIDSFWTLAASAPSVGSPTSSSITGTHATLGGTITSAGTASVTGSGVCYSSTDNTPGFSSPGVPEAGVTCTSTSPAITTGTFTINTISLSSNKKYYFRAYATNSVGTGYSPSDGVNDNFTTLNITPISVSSLTQTGLTSYNATLQGSANPNGYDSTGHFRIFTSNPGNCTSDTGGLRVPQLLGDDIPLGAGSSIQPFSYTTNFNNGGWLSSLTSYWYCTYATNTNGTTGSTLGGTSGVVNFTTLDGPSSPCDAPSAGGGSLTMATACTFNNTYDGVDSGGTGSNTAGITLNAGGILTLQPGQTVARGSGGLRTNGGQMITSSGGMLMEGQIYVKDADNDGVVDFPVVTTVATSKPAGYMRRNTVVGFTYMSKLMNASIASGTADCDSSNGYIYRNITNLVKDADNDGYKTSAAAATHCVGASAVFNGRTYYNDGSGSN